MEYDTLVLSGGAAKGIILLGSLQYIVDNSLLENIQNYVGTSVGAVIGYLLAIGYKPTEIMVYICTNRIIEKMRGFDWVSMMNNQGALSFKLIQESLENMTLEKIGKFITLKELYEEFGKKLFCCTYNMSTKSTEYINHENSPDLPCLTALRMSANVPLLFEKFKYSDHYYIDGGISDNFPIVMGNKVGKNVIGIRLKRDNVQEVKDDIGTLEYVFELLYVPIEQSIEHRCNSVINNCTIITILDKDSMMFNFNIETSTKLEMFSSGYQQTKTYFKEKN